MNIKQRLEAIPHKFVHVPLDYVSPKIHLTTGEIAAIVGVAPRTVTKWMDNGLLTHWRIPGSQDRRAHIKDFIEFLQRSKVPLPHNLRNYLIGTYLLDEETKKLPQLGIFHSVESDIEFGMLLRDPLIRFMLIGDSHGVQTMVDRIKLLHKYHPETTIVAVIGSDVSKNSIDVGQTTLNTTFQKAYSCNTSRRGAFAIFQRPDDIGKLHKVLNDLNAEINNRNIGDVVEGLQNSIMEEEPTLVEVGVTNE